MRMAVTGRAGQLVSALIERGAGHGVEIVPVGRPELDLADAASGMAALAATQPDIIVSAAAYTAVDKAESEPELARAINGVAPGIVAQCAAQLGVPVIHISTDYVFNGTKPTPYVETDPTDPLGVYGSTKLEGERAVAAATPDHAILRTAWVYSPFGGNFLKTMLRLAGDRPKLRVVGDQVGNPTSAADLADAVLRVAANLLAAPDDATLRGIFHAVGAGETSWAGFAREIFAASKVLGGAWAEVTDIPASEYPTPARRPANSRLVTDKLAALHGVRFPQWQASTADTVRRLLSPA